MAGNKGSHEGTPFKKIPSILSFLPLDPFQSVQAVEEGKMGEGSDQNEILAPPLVVVWKLVCSPKVVLWPLFPVVLERPPPSTFVTRLIGFFIIAQKRDPKSKVVFPSSDYNRVATFSPPPPCLSPLMSSLISDEGEKGGWREGGCDGPWVGGLLLAAAAANEDFKRDAFWSGPKKGGKRGSSS